MRLDQERQKRLEPRRMRVAKAKIEAYGYTIESANSTTIEFFFKGNRVVFFPYSGWHSGKEIKAGRGLNNLLKQIV